MKHLKKFESFSPINEEEGIFGRKNAWDKAIDKFCETHKDLIDKRKEAEKSKDPESYSSVCQELSQAVQKEYQALAKEFKIEGANDIGLLQREMKDKVIPMEPEVFKRQAEKGISMKDIASGSSAGRDKFK